MRSEILQVMQDEGAPMATWRIRRRLPRSTASPTHRVRAELERMAVRGLVRRHPRYSTVNNIVWELSPTPSAGESRE